MNSPAVPTATYRLQFNRDFTFADAVRIIPYLQQLGISHVYASPFLKARSGSPHGYDIVDHNAINPEIGDAAAFNEYVETLHRHGMGQILDIVPNHMGVGGDDNSWWLDVLENGEASIYAAYFDIDWHPVNPALRHKVLLPFLGDHYGTVLEEGELQLSLDADSGVFGVRYYEHLFPMDPRTWPRILAPGRDEVTRQSGDHREALAGLDALIAVCRALPRRTETSGARRLRRRQGTADCKERLVGLCRDHPEIRLFIDNSVARLNGIPGQATSFDALHRLLEAQAYRLAYWLVAADEINYRRFFDINDLAGLRMENDEVFHDTHQLIRRFVADGSVDGLRIDHPDGLSDPFGYYRDLRNLVRESRGEPCYMLVEKILAGHESLPFDWPVDGTTGYETAHLLNGLFIDPDSERRLTLLYRRFTGRGGDFSELLYDCKKLVMRSVLGSELTVLANLAGAVARSDRHTRDFTYQRLRDALADVVACFPVYRTYVTRHRSSERDRGYIDWAVAQAKKRNPAADVQIFDFIRDLLSLQRVGQYSARLQRRMLQFALRFQQYTAPVMAKGMEDTAFYIDNRLISLNDVGFDPHTFSVSVDALHLENHKRLSNRPETMVTTSTHDSKRGEDVRARINVLSELPGEWGRRLARWTRINRKKKRRVNGAPAPCRNDEYLLYQTLVGAWPSESDLRNELEACRGRIENYMIKAAREAKTHTSWVNPNEEYEETVRGFVRGLLDESGRNPFLADFVPFQRRINRFGLLNSLSQTLLKLTVPGVPDIYQGNELWSFNLVDPDNRRAVDYALRQQTLQKLAEQCEDTKSMPELARQLIDSIEDGRAKLYLTWKTLALRRRCPDLFRNGDYQPLETQGRYAAHLFSFARQCGNRQVIVAASRWFARLAGASDGLPAGGTAWEDTSILVPGAVGKEPYFNVLTGETVETLRDTGEIRLNATDLFQSFPLALLTSKAVCSP